MNRQSWLCSTCGTEQATTFCSCSGKRETFLCEGCLPSHYNKNPGLVHLFVPVSAYGEQTIPGYYDRLHVRATQIPIGRDELLENLTAIDVCITEFNSKVETAINTLREYAQRRLTQLQEVKTELERNIKATIEEVERTMYFDHPILEKKYSKELRHFGEACKSLQLFRYQQNECVLSLDNLLLFQTPEFPEQLPILPSICDNYLRLYNVLDSHTSHSVLSRKFTKGTFYCPIDDNEVLCIGDYPASTKTFSLRLSDYQLSELQSMKDKRGYPGVIKYGLFVYVFGGYSDSSDIVSCEKFSFAHGNWVELPEMRHPRRAFAPCLFQEEVFMSGIFEAHKVLETFNLVSEQFNSLVVELPKTGYDSISFIDDGELVIITNKEEMWRWTIGSAEWTFRISTVVNAGAYACSSCPVFRTGRDVFWIRFTSGDLNVFDLDTYVISKRELEEISSKESIDK